MMKTRVVLAATLLLVAWAIGGGVGSAQQRDVLHVLGAGWDLELVDLLENELLPAFEAQHNVDVQIEPVGWDERVDRIQILVASGLPLDVIATGYYSPYQEGASGLLAPLDRYIETWEHAGTIPGPVWETQRWRGSIMAVPLEFDLRGIGYFKSYFSEAGLDPERPPASWEELLEAVRRTTRLDSSGETLAVRGIAFWEAAQEMIGYIHTAGVAPVELEVFRSNLNTPQAAEAVRFYLELNRAARFDLDNDATAMMTVNPGFMRLVHGWIDGDFAGQFGVFAPRRSPAQDPVAVGFINGLAIASGSTKKDLAWKFIEFMLSDEVLLAIQPVTGWMPPRVDLAPEYGAPHLDIYYPLVPYIKPAQLPPPGHLSQWAFEDALQRALAGEISPEQALMEGHDVWARHLNEWRAELGE